MTNNERIARELFGWSEKDRPFELYDVFLDAAYLMEEKIKEKGWGEEYAKNLIAVIRPDGEHLRADIWDCIFFDLFHATPAQRVEAAIRMLDERGQE